MPEAAHGPTRHDTEIKPRSTGTNRDPFGVNNLPGRGYVGTGRDQVRLSFIAVSQRFDVIDGYKLINANGFCQI